MPKANLRSVRGATPLQTYECTVCKTKFVQKFNNLGDQRAIAELKAAILDQWDKHLYTAHRRQWDSLQKRRTSPRGSKKPEAEAPHETDREKTGQKILGDIRDVDES